jgi:uncharacterized MAPEG superfamily protein
MTHLSLLAPAAVLVLWTLIMLLWTGATRFPAMKRMGLDIKVVPPGGRGANLEGVLPPEVNWKSHNYTHLVEQPTLFYAVVLILFVGGGTTPLTVGLAWAYTAIRIVHSLWQALVNKLPVRFTLFVLSTLCLLALSVMAVILTLG